jgi:hypothetical protein
MRRFQRKVRSVTLISRLHAREESVAVFSSKAGFAWSSVTPPCAPKADSSSATADRILSSNFEHPSES